MHLLLQVLKGSPASVDSDDNTFPYDQRFYSKNQAPASVDSDDYTFPYDQRFYSKNQAFYLIFQEDSNLVLRNSTDNEIMWETNTSSIDDNPNFQGSICMLHNNGNFVIYDKNKKPIWSSGRKPLEVCTGLCTNDSSCSLGLECYDPSNPHRRLLNSITPDTGQSSLSSASSNMVRMAFK